MFTLLKRSARAKWLALSTLNWFQQTCCASPLNWPRLPGELHWFLSTLREYRRLAVVSGEQVCTHPILFQREQVGFDAQYTYQAAWATRRIIQLKPPQHVDVSSDLRFVTQLSAYVPVLYIEYRPVRVPLAGLRMQQGSVLQLPFADRSIGSVSCLHVIEHIGLGRYGDPLDVNGSQKALVELARVVAPQGSLLLSTPIGRSRTLFNAHRILDPVAVLTSVPCLELTEFSVVTTGGKFIESTTPAQFADEDYACGLYWFKRES